MQEEVELSDIKIKLQDRSAVCRVVLSFVASCRKLNLVGLDQDGEDTGVKLLATPVRIGDFGETKVRRRWLIDAIPGFVRPGCSHRTRAAMLALCANARSCGRVTG